MVRRAGKRQEKTNTRPEVIITTEKVIVEVGAYDELPGEVVNVPGESEYLFSLPDMVPGGEHERGGECDKGVNISNMERGGLVEDVQNRETRREENTKDEHEAKEEQITGQRQRLRIVGWNWWKIPTQKCETNLFKDWESVMIRGGKYS